MLGERLTIESWIGDDSLEMEMMALILILTEEDDSPAAHGPSSCFSGILRLE